MKHIAEYIIKELGIEEEVVAIYRYGSQVYGTASKYSDHDYVIVAKSTLNSGAFKNNAVSNKDYTIQGTLYSRAGFQDAINTYQMPAMECMSLADEDIVLKKWPFKVREWKQDEMVKQVIKLASASRHIADKNAKHDHMEQSKRGMFHALRILHFGLQLKEHQKIVNFGECNALYHNIINIDEDEFDTRDWYEMFDNLKKKLEE